MPRGKSNNYNYYYPQRSKVVGNRNKYSTQTYLVRNTANLDAGASQYFTVVPPTDVAGKRKVKNISIQLAFDSSLTGAIDADASVFWCIVYVPKGSVPGAIGQLNGIFYTPPQFIMSSGIYNVKNPGNTARIFTPLSRNLNEGDGIAFVYTSDYAMKASQLSAVINYAITLQ